MFPNAPQEGGTASPTPHPFSWEPPKARWQSSVYVEQSALGQDKKAIRTVHESGFNDHLYQNDLWGLLNLKFSGPSSGDRIQEYIFLIVSPDDSYAH